MCSVSPTETRGKENIDHKCNCRVHTYYICAPAYLHTYSAKISNPKKILTVFCCIAVSEQGCHHHQNNKIHVNTSLAVMGS